MVTKAQIDRLCQRIEALSPKSDRVVFVWKPSETEDEALERRLSRGTGRSFRRASLRLQLARGMRVNLPADFDVDGHLTIKS